MKNLRIIIAALFIVVSMSNCGDSVYEEVEGDVKKNINIDAKSKVDGETGEDLPDLPSGG